MSYYEKNLLDFIVISMYKENSLIPGNNVHKSSKIKSMKIFFSEFVWKLKDTLKTFKDNKMSTLWNFNKYLKLNFSIKIVIIYHYTTGVNTNDTKEINISLKFDIKSHETGDELFVLYFQMNENQIHTDIYCFESDSVDT